MPPTGFNAPKKLDADSFDNFLATFADQDVGTGFVQVSLTDTERIDLVALGQLAAMGKRSRHKYRILLTEVPSRFRRLFSESGLDAAVPVQYAHPLTVPEETGPK